VIEGITSLLDIQANKSSKNQIKSIIIKLYKMESLSLGLKLLLMIQNIIIFGRAFNLIISIIFMSLKVKSEFHLKV
jgi:hypothetical protein